MGHKEALWGGSRVLGHRLGPAIGSEAHLEMGSGVYIRLGVEGAETGGEN